MISVQCVLLIALLIKILLTTNDNESKYIEKYTWLYEMEPIGNIRQNYFIQIQKVSLI